MKTTAYLSILCTAVAGCSTPTKPHIYDDLNSIEGIRDSFVRSAKENGLTLPFVPSIREWTRPSLISWRKEAKAVALPRWEELSSDARNLVTTMAGNTTEPRRLFDLLFRWFLVPHELTHAFQDEVGAPKSPAQSERFANDVAVAFHSQQPGAESRLAELERILTSSRERLPKPLHDADFDSRYQSPDLASYAACQVGFILSSLEKRHSLNFAELMKQLPLSVGPATDRYYLISKSLRLRMQPLYRYPRVPTRILPSVRKPLKEIALPPSPR
ncbi:MAG: hypothetical protein A2428_08635 [Bdellovibrionales bacterium RIFOXYC1_FULL_54_43]|nr:MAG: hypothetical protein A2428_08635 [Bdellovibrionales bacterium RIFOXYC1_FULL_54_43]OFZ84282.1 MAG: hypothetical protein A2603_15215 [Bdellovibrionales bacterium RIFOXYD1_FULL_55_31]